MPVPELDFERNARAGAFRSRGTAVSAMALPLDEPRKQHSYGHYLPSKW